MNLSDVDLLKLQTSFMQNDKTTQGLCAGLTPELRNIADQIKKIIIYHTLDEVQDNEFGHALLDELAWQYHVDFYDTSASIEVKKGLVKQSVTIHRKKGTPKAVEDLLTTAFASDTILLEWFNYKGKPYHFKIVTSSIDENKMDEFKRALNTVKNVRSYLDGIELFTVVYMYSVNILDLESIITYTPNDIVSAGEFQPLTFADGETLTVSNGDEIGFFS